MPFTQELPVWGAAGTKPPQSKLDTGWAAGDKPPADWLNWKENRTYLVLQELQNDSIHEDQKGVPNGVATLGADGKIPPTQLSITQVNAFSTIKVGATNITPENSTDTLEFVAGTNVTITPNATNDSITINATAPAQTAANTSVVDAGNHFTSSNVEGALDELFTFASNGKSSVAAAAGSPSVSSDTFTKIAGDITAGKASIASAARSKGASVNDSDSMETIAAAVGGIALGKKTASGTVTRTDDFNIAVTGLAFKPRVVSLSTATALITVSSDGSLDNVAKIGTSTFTPTVTWGANNVNVKVDSSVMLSPMKFSANE